MKKRVSVKSKRRVSSRKSVSGSKSSWFDNLRETITRRREFVFLFLALAMGMLIFDIIGYDYTGLVIENNAVSGAQTAIPDNMITLIGNTIKGAIKLIFGGLLAPVLNAFKDNAIIATKLALFVIIVFFILPVVRKIFKVDNGGNAMAANAVAILITLLGVAFLPEGFVRVIRETFPALIIVGFILGILYGMFKWKPGEEKFQHVLRGITALALMFILSYMLEAMEITNKTDGVSSAILLFAMLAIITLLWIFISGVLIYSWKGSKSLTEMSRDRAEKGKEDDQDKRDVGKLQKERRDATSKHNADKDTERSRTMVNLIMSRSRDLHVITTQMRNMSLPVANQAETNRLLSLAKSMRSVIDEENKNFNGISVLKDIEAGFEDSRKGIVRSAIREIVAQNKVITAGLKGIESSPRTIDNAYISRTIIFPYNYKAQAVLRLKI